MPQVVDLPPFGAHARLALVTDLA
ncbi:MAG: hypothetical protein RL199_1959, partial [Pseudomonadota bacterium]